jgi:hypothetical protein
VTKEEVDEYFAATTARIRPPFYIERRFRANEEWDRVSAYEFRNISLSDSTEVTLTGTTLLRHRSSSPTDVDSGGIPNPTQIVARKTPRPRGSDKNGQSSTFLSSSRVGPTRQVSLKAFIP